MRGRWLAVPGLALLALTAGACGDGKDKTVAPPVKEDALDGAVEIAQLSLPGDLPDSRVADLIEGLCSAGSGSPAGLVTELQGLALDQAQMDAALDALAAGADGYCPDDVDPAVDAIQAAVAPTSTTTSATTPSAAVAGAGSGGSGSSATQSSGSSSSGSASTSSSGSASTGSGNATGTGNSSGTDFTQSVGSSGSSNSSSTSDG